VGKFIYDSQSVYTVYNVPNKQKQVGNQIRNAIFRQGDLRPANDSNKMLITHIGEDSTLHSVHVLVLLLHHPGQGCLLVRVKPVIFIL
jgi:hypothetical protein